VIALVEGRTLSAAGFGSQLILTLDSYSGIFQAAGGLCVMVGLFIGVIKGRLAPAAAGFFGGGVLIFAVPLTKFFLAGDSKASPTVPSTTPTPTPVPTQIPQQTAQPVDFSWVPGALMVLVVVVVVLLVVLGIAHYFRRSVLPAAAKKRSDAHMAGQLVTEARKTLQEVILESASYETDLARQIDYPMMTDAAEPLVSQYIREMRSAQELDRAMPPKPSVDDARAFSEAAIHLKVSFDAAVSRAEKIHWSNFSVEEQKRLKDARVALDVIQDASTTAEQRNAQHRRVTKLLDGLIVLTGPVKLALGRWVPMLAIGNGEHLESDEERVTAQ
jgi:hypothetical protein